MERLVDVIGEDGGRQPELGIVRSLQSLFIAVDRVDRCHGTKGLGPAYGHVLGYACQKCRLTPVAFPRAADDNGCPVRPCILDVIPHPIALPLRDDRRNDCIRIAEIAHARLRRDLREALDEFIVDRAFHVEPAGADAELPAKHEDRACRQWHALVQIGIRQDKRGALATQLERVGCLVPRADFGDVPTDDGRARETHEVHVRAAGQVIADFRSVSGDHVAGARREPGLGKNLGHQDRHMRRHLGGQVHNGVSDGEGIGDEARILDERHVERRDDRNHAEGFAD